MDNDTSKQTIVIYKDGAIKKYDFVDELTVKDRQQIENFDNVLSITIGTDITRIGPDVFHSCHKLPEMIFPVGLKSIGSMAFCATEIEYIELPDTVTSVEDSAFSMCYIKEILKLPANLTSLGKFAFAFCHELPNISYKDKTYDSLNELTENMIANNVIMNVGVFHLSEIGMIDDEEIYEEEIFTISEIVDNIEYSMLPFNDCSEVCNIWDRCFPDHGDDCYNDMSVCDLSEEDIDETCLKMNEECELWITYAIDNWDDIIWDEVYGRKKQDIANDLKSFKRNYDRVANGDIKGKIKLVSLYVHYSFRKACAIAKDLANHGCSEGYRVIGEICEKTNFYDGYGEDVDFGMVNAAIRYYILAAEAGDKCRFTGIVNFLNYLTSRFDICNYAGYVPDYKKMRYEIFSKMDDETRDEMECYMDVYYLNNFGHMSDEIAGFTKTFKNVKNFSLDDIWRMIIKITEDGNAQGQYLVARAHEEGNWCRFIDQDYDEALRWYHNAAKQGHKEAAKCYKRLSEELGNDE